MSDLQHEYYIRQPDDTEARGPFTLAQLASLAGEGGIDSRTLYFDAGSEQWVAVAGSDDLGILLRGARANRVAFGTGGGTDKSVCATLRCARVLLFGSAAVFLLLAFVSMRRGGGVLALVSQPVFWLGVIDVWLGAGAAFFARRLALIIRLRAALGFGFLCVLFWLVAAIPALVFAAVASACLWLATVLRGRRALLIDTIAGLAALAGFAYWLL